MLKNIQGKKLTIFHKKNPTQILKINSHVPFLHLLAIKSLTPIKNENENVSLMKQQCRHRTEMKEGRFLIQRRINRNKSHYESSNSIKTTKNHESFYILAKNQIGKEIFNQAQRKFHSRNKIKNSTLHLQVKSNYEQQFTQQKTFQNKFIDHTYLEKSTQISSKKCTSFSLSICHVLNQCLYFSGDTNAQNHKNDVEFATNTNQKKLIEQGTQTVEIEDIFNRKLYNLRRQIIQRQRLLNKMKTQIEEAETRINQLQIKELNHSKQVQQHIAFTEQAQKLKKEMENFIFQQPNLILKSQVKGYKRCEQNLFDLADRLEFSKYQSMLHNLYEQIEIPQKSFFYNIDTFEFKRSVEDNFALLDTFKEKLKSIYQNIMKKIKAILKLKSEKIQLFVNTLRELASYTIGKRQYLTELNNKMIIIGTLSDNSIKQLEFQQNGPQKIQVSKIISIINALRNVYNEAQVFY